MTYTLIVLGFGLLFWYWRRRAEEDATWVPDDEHWVVDMWAE